MKAIVFRAYGPPDGLTFEEIDKPTPADDEVLIEVRAASVNPLDWHFMRGSPYLIRIMVGMPQPKDTRLGVDVAGRIEAVGKNVTLKAGDEVFGSCKGAFAEYACTAESDLVVKPDSIAFEQAAAINVAGVTALQALRDYAHVQPGQHVLINGAAGGVGTFAVQIAKTFGAEVTGVCSTRNVDFIRSIGADHAIDYTRDDFTKSDAQYDAILDCIANHSIFAIRRVLKPKGIYVGIGGKISNLPKALVCSPLARRKVVLCMTKSSKEDLTILRDLITAGKVTPIIDRTYELAEVPQAIAYLEEGHARGKAVIRVPQTRAR